MITNWAQVEHSNLTCNNTQWQQQPWVGYLFHRWAYQTKLLCKHTQDCCANAVLWLCPDQVLAVLWLKCAHVFPLLWLRGVVVSYWCGCIYGSVLWLCAVALFWLCCGSVLWLCFGCVVVLCCGSVLWLHCGSTLTMCWLCSAFALWLYCDSVLWMWFCW